MVGRINKGIRHNKMCDRLVGMPAFVSALACLLVFLFVILHGYGSAHGEAAISGRTFYVAPNGNNANPGTYERPWATPGYGSRRLQPGDTLIILGGRYILSEYDGDIIRPPSGTPSAWITIKGEEGNRPVLAGRDDLITAINLSGVQYVRIENLEIAHDDTATGEAAWFRDGVEILGAPSAHIVLKDLYIHHIDEFGMNIQDVDDLQIINCRIEYCGFGALGGPEGEHGGWRNVVIRGCSLSWSGHYYQGGDGSNRPYDRPDGFGIEPSQGPILIEDTVAEHNYGDGLDSKAANTVIRRCIVANNSCDGVKLWADGSRIENTLIYGRGDGDPTPTPWAPIVIDQVEQAGARFEIVNVTVDDYVGQNYLMYVQYDNPVPVHVTVRNTIFSGRGPGCPIYIGATSTLVAEHNLFYLPRNEFILVHGETTYTSADLSMLGTGNIYGNPLFVRPAWGEPGDYHLQAGSPAINAGTAKGAPTVDLDNRPRDAHPDIGAYEYGAVPLLSPLTFRCDNLQIPGKPFWVDVVVGSDKSPVSDLFGISFKLNFTRTDILDFVEAKPGDFLGSDVIWLPPMVDEDRGAISISITRKAPAKGVNGTGVVVRVEMVFKAGAAPNSISTLSFSDVTAINSVGQAVPLSVESISIRVGQPIPIRILVPSTVSSGAEFDAEIVVGDQTQQVTNLFGISFKLKWDPGNALDLSAGSKAGKLFEGRDPMFMVQKLDGGVGVSVALKGGVSGISGFGSVAVIKLRALSTDRDLVVSLSLLDITAQDPGGKSIYLSGDGAKLTIQSGIDVWPGDTNNDGIVDERDVLPVGRYWMKRGPAREPRSTEWKAQKCKPWDPKEATYADANGDGIVDEREILVIGMNWMKRRTGAPSLASPHFQIRYKPSAKEIEAYRRMYRVLEDNGMKGEEVERLKGVLRLLISGGLGEARTGIGNIYPNPFSSPVHIPYYLDRSGHISLKVYNPAGQLVETIFEGYKEAGIYDAVWEGEKVCDGVYIFVLRVDGKTYCTKGVRK